MKQFQLIAQRSQYQSRFPNGAETWINIDEEYQVFTGTFYECVTYLKGIVFGRSFTETEETPTGRICEDRKKKECFLRFRTSKTTEICIESRPYK